MGRTVALVTDLIQNNCTRVAKGTWRAVSVCQQAAEFSGKHDQYEQLSAGHQQAH
jgi:hypothetical protein